mmetsp:Transcript_10732/g.23299  ORF Transcript_10732/g.23299 Transcript_10732/m.23299 type:complete len:343 (+) Transcript_10732:2-1030(+)
MPLLLFLLTTIPIILLLLAAVAPTAAFSAGRGFGPYSDRGSDFASFDRFRAACPADASAVRRFDPSLVEGNEKEEGGGGGNDDVWVAVYRSANNLPSVFVRDAFFDAMRASTTTAQGGDSETLVSTSSSSQSIGVISNNGNDGSDEDDDKKPVAVARLGKDADSNMYILDSMRCVLKKENTDDDCDGGSEHAEAIGVCIDELVISYLQRYLQNESDGAGEDEMTFDGGIRFRGTLVSGKLLDSRGFREVSELSSDMHSHESDYDGALNKYAERSTSKVVAKNPGARDRALKILSCLGRVDREEDQRRARLRKGDVGGGKRGDGAGEEEQSDFDPWASVKSYI